MNSYRVLKIFNNNAILVLDLSTQREAVFFNKGIGFGKKEGQTLEIKKDTIEKSYLTYDEEFREIYVNLLKGIDNRIFEVCLEIIDLAEKHLGPLNPRLRLVLTDHIVFTIERMKNNQTIFNPFVDEIRIIYPEEYAVAEIAQKMLRNQLDVHFSQDEIGFIAMHLYAARKNQEVKESVKNIRLVNEMIQIIEHSLGKSLDRGFDYSRLVFHLRSTIERVTENKSIRNPLLHVLKTELKQSYQIAEQLKLHLKDKGPIDIPEDEVGYMAIHINRFC